MKEILTDEEARLKHNEIQRRHYYLKRSGYVRPKLNEEEKRIRHNLIQRKHSYSKTHGATINDYNALFAEQNYRCAICGSDKTIPNRPLCLDHDHRTGKIRAVLCHRCNINLGNYNDNVSLCETVISRLNRDIEYISKIIKYLKKYEKPAV